MTASGRALILGISGQDGAYLSRQLIDEGWEVHGTSRSAPAARFENLDRVGTRKAVHMHRLETPTVDAVSRLFDEIRPGEVYNLAAQSSVGASFGDPAGTFESIVGGTQAILEAMRLGHRNIRFCNAGSSDSFGETPDAPATETTPLRPRSPYAVAKAASQWMVATYREAYGLFAATGILFNHESPLRPDRFVTRKIVRTAVDIAQARARELTLGDITVRRDWGWAPDHVDALRRMMRHPEPEDFVIATGRLSSLEEFVEQVFARLGLDWRDHVKASTAPPRPLDVRVSWGDPSKAGRLLGWRPTRMLPEIAGLLVNAERESRLAGS
jgi:GDPmannose 4,6-dehydratase